MKPEMNGDLMRITSLLLNVIYSHLNYQGFLSVSLIQCIDHYFAFFYQLEVIFNHQLHFADLL